MGNKKVLINSFEEYRQFAMNRPHPAGSSFFRLEMVITDNELDEGETRYPEYDTAVRERLYFRSLEQAEAKIERLKTEFVSGEEITVIGYYIEEFPFCEGEYAEESLAYSPISRRLYDDCGILVDKSKVSELDIHYNTEYGKFYGRDESEIRFKEGEIVEVYDPYNNKIRLYIISGNSLSTEYCWQRFRKNGDCWLDYTDDTITIIDGFDDAKWNHDHISPMFIFKPHFAVPEEIRQQFENSYKAFCEEVGRNKRNV